jgi:hypothetical protein
LEELDERQVVSSSCSCADYAIPRNPLKEFSCDRNSGTLHSAQISNGYQNISAMAINLGEEVDSTMMGEDTTGPAPGDELCQ